MHRVKRVAVGLVIAVLVVNGAYAIYIAVVAISTGKGHGAAFWTAIAMLAGFAVFAFWLAKRLYVRRFAIEKPSPPEA
jgi:Kef-type K+ transport system membrane component KefB